MKRVLVVLAFIAAYVSIKSVVPNKYTLEEPDAIKVFNQLQILKEVLPNSDIPAKNVTQIVKQTDSLQAIIVTQYNKFHPDTTAKPKK